MAQDALSGAGLLSPGQRNAEVIFNDAILRLIVLSTDCVDSIAPTPPAVVTAPYLMILGASHPTRPNQLAYYWADQNWFYMAAPQKSIYYNLADSKSYLFNGTAWSVIATGSGGGGSGSGASIQDIVSAINAHSLATDPHSVYLTKAEGDALYSGGAVWQELADPNIQTTLNGAYICTSNGTTRQIFTLPTPVLGGSIRVQGRGTAGFQVIGGTIYFSDGTFNTGVRNINNHRYAILTLRCVDAATNVWIVDQPIDKTGVELFSTTIGLLPETIAIVDRFAAIGYAVPSSEQTAINAFYTATSSLRSAVAHEYGFIGSASNFHAVNWVSSVSNTLSFTGSVTHNATGSVTSAGGAIRSGYRIPSTKESNFAIAVYLTSVSSANNFIAGSSRIGSGFTLRTNNVSFSALTMGSSSINLNAGISKGFLAVSRVSNASAHLLFGAINTANSQFVVTSDSSTAAPNPPNPYLDDALSEILFGSELNNGGASGDGVGIGHAVIFNRGLTLAELTTYGNAVATLQTALGRA